MPHAWMQNAADPDLRCGDSRAECKYSMKGRPACDMASYLDFRAIAVLVRAPEWRCGLPSNTW
jgi:hypothetical protein